MPPFPLPVSAVMLLYDPNYMGDYVEIQRKLRFQTPMLTSVDSFPGLPGRYYDWKLLYCF